MDVQDFSCVTEKPDTLDDAFNKLLYRRNKRHLTEMKICIAVLWVKGVYSLLGD
jgi:hypothetical protein